MKWFLSLFLCMSASAQLPVIPYPVPSGASRWWPTNATSGTLIHWAELTPIDGTFGGSTGTIVPAGNGNGVKFWTNFAAVANPTSKWTADQTLWPTNFTSGGGGNSTSPHNVFGLASSPTRMVSGSWPGTFATNLSTWIIVANNTSATSTDPMVVNGLGDPFVQFNNKKLEMSQGTTLSSGTAVTVQSQYYVMTFVFAAGASSHIDTNGVTMVTGNAGTDNMSLCYLGNNVSPGPSYNGSICRVWIWAGVLNGTDLSKAVAQCRTDFGI